MKDLIIFDFDGVIADSFNTFYPLIRDGMDKIGISIPKKGYKELFNDNIHKGFEKLIKDNKKHKIFNKFRADNYNRYYAKNPPKLFLGIKKILKKLSNDYILTIASSGRKYNITWLLKKNGSHKHFNLILATSEKTKENMLREIIEKHEATPKHTTMVTDTVGDIKIAKKLGLKTIAVSWGFQNSKTLKKSKPSKLLHKVGDLEKFLKK